MSDKQIKRLIKNSISTANKLVEVYGKEATIELVYFQFLNSLFSISKGMNTNQRTYLVDRTQEILYLYDRYDGLD